MCGLSPRGQWGAATARWPGARPPLEPGDRAVPSSAGPSGRFGGEGAGPAAGSLSNGAWPGSPARARPARERAAASPGLSAFAAAGAPGACFQPRLGPSPDGGGRSRAAGFRLNRGCSRAGRGRRRQGPGVSLRSPERCPGAWPSAPQSSRGAFSDQPVETTKPASQRFCFQGFLTASPPDSPLPGDPQASARPRATASPVWRGPVSPQPHSSLPTLLLAIYPFPSLTRARTPLQRQRKSPPFSF